MDTDGKKRGGEENAETRRVKISPRLFAAFASLRLFFYPCPSVSIRVLIFLFPSQINFLHAFIVLHIVHGAFA